MCFFIMALSLETADSAAAAAALPPRKRVRTAGVGWEGWTRHRCGWGYNGSVKSFNISRVEKNAGSRGGEKTNTVFLATSSMGGARTRSVKAVELWRVGSGAHKCYLQCVGSFQRVFFPSPGPNVKAFYIGGRGGGVLFFVFKYYSLYP